MQRFYLVPIEEVVIGATTYRGPEYVVWRYDQDLDSLAFPWSMMDYGFVPSALLLAKDISLEDHDALVLHADVFAFPEVLDGPVDQDVGPFFEAIHLPTDWLTPATTWRELLRQLAGMFLFNQRYGGIAAAETGEWHSIFENADLDTRLRQMTLEEQAWFLATVESFGFDPALVNLNDKLRSLVKTAGTYWEDQPFFMGGVEF